MKKSALLALVLPFLISNNANAAAVAGSDDWKDLEEQEELTSENPAEIHGKLKIARNIFHGTEHYPKYFGQDKTTAEFQIDWRLRFAPRWHFKGRLQGNRYWAEEGNDTKLKFKQIYVEGKIGAVELRGGKIPIFDALNLSGGGLVIDSEIIGGQLKIPVGSWNILASGGVIDNDDYDLTRVTTIFDTNSTYISLQAFGNIGEKVSASVGVHNMHNTAGGLTLPNGQPYSPGGKGFFQSGTEKNNTVWTVGADYHFGENLTFGGIYSVGSAKISEQAKKNAREDSNEDKSFSIQLTYGKPELKEKNNFSAWLAYRQAGRIGSYTPAYNGVGFGERGFEVGARYNILKDLTFETVYFSGKKVSKISPPAPDIDKPHIKKFYFGLSYEF